MATELAQAKSEDSNSDARELLIVRYDREETRRFRDADNFAKQSKAAELEGCSAQRKSDALRKEIADEKMLREWALPIAQVLRRALDEIHHPGANPGITDRLEAAIRLAETGVRT